MVVGCNTCVSETTAKVSTFLRQILDECAKNDLDVQLLNSDGASYDAVKNVAEEYNIASA